MAINKKLIHFQNYEKFLDEKEHGNILDTSICFIKDRQLIYTHRKGYQAVPEGGKEGQILTVNDKDEVIWKDVKDNLYVIPEEILYVILSNGTLSSSQYNEIKQAVLDGRTLIVDVEQGGSVTHVVGLTQQLDLNGNIGFCGLLDTSLLVISILPNGECFQESITIPSIDSIYVNFVTKSEFYRVQEQLNTILNGDTSAIDAWYEIENFLQGITDKETLTGLLQNLKSDIKKENINIFIPKHKQTIEFDTNGHEYVDLGLPSGNLWATCNVGSETPEEKGLFFQWGDTEGDEGGGDKKFEWSTYKWCNYIDHQTLLTKYCQNYINGYEGYTDDLTQLELEDDAAHVHMGGDWAMPSLEDILELGNNCNYETIISENGNTIKWTSRKNGKSIIIPMGFIPNGNTVQTAPFIATKDLVKENSLQFYYFYPTTANARFDRSAGFQVRGIIKTKSDGLSGDDIFTKQEGVDLEQNIKSQLTNKLSKSEASSTYQPKGDYATKKDLENIDTREARYSEYGLPYPKLPGQVLYTTFDNKPVVTNCKSSLIKSNEYYEDLGYGSIIFTTPTRIPDLAFGNRNDDDTDYKYNLQYASMSDSFTTIGCCSFRRSTLVGIRFSKNFTTFDASKTSEYGYVNGMWLTDSIAFARSNIEELYLPDSFTNGWGSSSAFKKCSRLSKIRFSPNTTIISGYSFFEDCTAIEHLYIPDNITTISKANGIFRGCTSLKTVRLSPNMTIDDDSGNTFGDCKLLETIILPTNIETIPNNFLANCWGLKEITIPSKVINMDWINGARIEKLTIHANVTRGNGWYTTARYIDSSSPIWPTNLNVYYNCNPREVILRYTKAVVENITILGINNMTKIWVPAALLEQYKEIYPDFANYFHPLTGDDRLTALEKNGLKEDGSYPDMTVGSAENLQVKYETINDSAYGIMDSTDKDNDYKYSTIESIQGNSISWCQLVKPSWTATNAELTIDNGEITLTPTAETDVNCYQSDLKLTNTHKYYFRFQAKASEQGISDNDTLGEIACGSDHKIDIDGNLETDWITFDKIFTYERQDSDDEIANIYLTANYRNEETGTKIPAMYRNVILLDLTLIYGIGNEPEITTQIDVDYIKWFGKVLTSEDYDTGSIRSVLMTGIRNTGSNLWDGSIAQASYYLSNATETVTSSANYDITDFIQVFPNTQYYINQCEGSAPSILFFDRDKRFISGTKHASKGTLIFTTPENCFYIKDSKYKTKDYSLSYYKTGKNTNVNEPYWEKTVELPPITSLTSNGVVIFPDGLKRVGEYRDEIYVDNGVTKAIKRVGSTKLGSLTWTVLNDTDNLKYRYRATISTMYKNSTTNYDIITSVLPNGATKQEHNGISSQNTYIYAFYEPFGEASNASGFKSAMANETIYYRLATPVEYIVDNLKMPIIHEVDDYGINEVISEENGLSPRIVSKYGIDVFDALKGMENKLEGISEGSMTEQDAEIMFNKIFDNNGGQNS